MFTHCPKCKQWLTLSQFKSEKCVHCGVDLNSERFKIRAVLFVAIAVIAVGFITIVSFISERPTTKFGSLMAALVSTTEELADAYESGSDSATIDQLTERIGTLDREMRSIEIQEATKNQIIEQHRNRLSLALERVAKTGRYTVKQDDYQLLSK